MGVQIASSAISGGYPVAIAAGTPPGGWLPWVIGLLVALSGAVVSLVAHRAARGDRHQDRATEAVCAFEELVGQIELEQHRLVGQVVSLVDLKPLRDLLPKAELAPDRLPQPLRLCARELESRLAKYLTVLAGPPPTGCSAEERDAWVEQRWYAGQYLKRSIDAAFQALARHKDRRKG